MTTRLPRKRNPGRPGKPRILKEVNPARLESDSPVDKETDLAEEEGVPTERSDVDLRLEKIWLQIKMPGWLGGTTFELNSEVFTDSALGTATATLLLVGAGCLVTGIVHVIGVPVIAAVIVGLCVPIGTFALVRILSGRRTR